MNCVGLKYIPLFYFVRFIEIFTGLAVIVGNFGNGAVAVLTREGDF